MRKSIYIKWTAIVLCVVFNVTDIITTIMAQLKHSHVSNETNPLFVWIPSFYFIFIVKIIFIGWFIWFMVKYYHKLEVAWGRYIYVYLLVLLTVLTMGASTNNYAIWQLPQEQVTQVSDEQKIEAYKDAVLDLKLAQNAFQGPLTEDKPMPMGILPIIFLLNMIQFVVWRAFEQENEVRWLVT